MLAEVQSSSNLRPASGWTSKDHRNGVKYHSLQEPGVLQRPREPHRRLPSQKCCFLGVETCPEVLWEDWELGKDFTKTLSLKNINGKLQKLRFRPPVSKYFTTSVPQKIVLSPGTSYRLPVTFSPHERCVYEDSIQFQGKDGSFQVSLRATIPRHNLVVPESVVLPLCAVQHSSQTTFVLKNGSKLHTCFQWDPCAVPFQLSPEQGLLEPSQECRVTVVFQPQEALVYQRELVCRFGNEGEELLRRCTVLLQGPAKYPCLQLRCMKGKEQEESAGPVMRFGSVAIGRHQQKHFDIFNLSPVTASFTLSGLGGRTAQLGSEFVCDVSSGEVAPGASLRATVTYTPLAVDTVTTDYLTLVCPGALRKTKLKLTGNCIGPRVTVSCSVVDFGSVGDGDEDVREVDLVNSSPAGAVYQWDLDASGHSVFSIQPAGGTLRPNSHTTLKVVFRPRYPAIHHRRVACLILHKEPVFLVVIGTCHSELQRPAVLRPKHLDLYQLHRHRRLTQYPPNLLVGSDQSPERADDLEIAPMEEYHQACLGGLPDLSSSSAPFSSSTHVTVEPAELVFSHAPSAPFSLSSSSSRSVAITNRTKENLSLVWTAAPDSPFVVSPMSCDLGPLKSTSFRVTYAPKQLNTLHGAQLECFAIYKVLLEPGQVEDCFLCPPSCVTVRVIGHSFQVGREHFVPCCSLQQPTVVFPGVSVLSYRTVLFRNTGDLPITFNLNPDPVSSAAASVSVLPSCGLVLPGNYQIFTLRTTPAEDCPKQGFSIALQLNGGKYTQEMRVVSSVEKLRVFLEGGGSLHFQHTAVGSSSQRSHRIRNPMRIPLCFQWMIPGEERKIISVEPESGELQPNDSLALTWFFSPLEETTYHLKPSITFWPTQTPACNKSRLVLRVTGMGCQGSIQAENEVVELGETLVGGCRTVEVPLVNCSLCPVSVCLMVQQTLLGMEPGSNPCTEPNALQLESTRKTIPSCSRMLLRCTVTPHRRAQYQWTISYQTPSASGSTLSSPQTLCEVRGEGVYPTLQVVDARPGGSVSGLSKVQTWNRFSLDRFNSHLLSCPSPLEPTYRTPARHSLHRCPSILTTAILDFNFCAAPLGSEASTVLLLFDNIGPIPADWSLLFPEDKQKELQHWAESGESSSSEPHQMKVQDSHLFKISPRSGTLPPSQQRAVHFSYRHNFVGNHQLPVSFKMSHGREILLNFQGVTVERDVPYLHYSSAQHEFSPVAIGSFSPPIQVYQLYNGGAVPAHYQVDTSPLEQLQADNFDHQVLCCLNPQGVVPVGRTALLEWAFSPLEAKMYSVDIMIYVRGGDSMLVSFEGCGFNSRALGSSDPVYFPDDHKSVPCVQRVSLPEQVVFLSEERVCFGDVPVHCRSTKILFLTNVSQTDAVQYTWDLPEQDSQQIVQMNPEKGRLCPGESIMCVLALKTPGCATFYQLELICQITLEASLTEYRDSLRRWEEDRERRQHEFIITQNDLRGDQGIQEAQPQTAPVGDKPTLRKYKTLPPIRARSGGGTPVGGPRSRSTAADRRAQRGAVVVWTRPKPSAPTLLHLGVTARSHSLPEYQTFFANQLMKHHVRSCPQVESHSPHTTTPPGSLPPLTHGPERDILSQIFVSLFQSLLDDPDFQQRVAAPEPVPYFSQLGDTHHSGSPASCSAPASSRAEAPWEAGTRVGSTTCCRSVDHAGVAGVSSNRAGTQSTLCTPHSQHSEVTGEDQVQKNIRESIWRCAEFSDVCEYVLVNTLQNLMVEASLGEFLLTARPRTPRRPFSQESQFPGENVSQSGKVGERESQESSGNQQGLHQHPTVP